MALISGSIPNFINGVSQQALALRLSSQAEEQVNGLSTIVDGLKKRPPARHLAKLMAAPASPVFAHVINRDADERYVVLAYQSGLKVFDLNGVEKTVAFPDGTAYLNNANPDTRFGAVTIADYTFFVNKDVTVTMDAGSKSPARPYEALINIKQGNYGKTYEVTVNGAVVGTVSTPDGSAASQSPQIDTSVIAANLVTSFSTINLLGPAGFTVTRYANAIYLSHPTTDFTISIRDGFNGNAASVAKGSIQHFADLPLKGPAGFVVEVVGDSTTQFDNYWVTFDGAGVWKETVKPDIEWEYLPSTMPHTLVRESDGTFTFKEAVWDKRLVGDTDSNGQASFVGKKITDVFFHRNRLGFLSDENTILSQSGEFFQFWRQTVTAVLDDDPIDVGTPHAKVSLLRHAVPFRDLLVTFSDQTQFTLRAQGLLSPKTVAITPTTELPCSQYAKPVATGDRVFFFSDGNSVRAYEYKLDPDTQALTGEETTTHVPHYIPGGTAKAYGTPKHNFLGVSSSSAPSRLYVHQWLYQGSDKLQSAWHYWDLGTGAKVIAHDFVDSDMILVVQRGTDIWLESINVDPGKSDAGLDYWICLDRRVHSDSLAAGSYDAGDDRTSYTLPYTVPADIKAAVASNSGGLYAGMLCDVDSFTGATLRLKGDTRAVKLYIGVPYQFRYRLSTILPKKQTRTGEQVIADARLQLRYFSLVYGANTADLCVRVTPFGRATYQQVIGQYLLGTMSTDQPPLGPGGIIRVPVMSRADTTVIEAVSDSHLPCSLISGQWEGLLFVRAQPAN